MILVIQQHFRLLRVPKEHLKLERLDKTKQNVHFHHMTWDDSGGRQNPVLHVTAPHLRQKILTIVPHFVQFSPAVVEGLDSLSEQQILWIFFLSLDEFVGEIEHLGVIFLVGGDILFDSLVVGQKLFSFRQITGNVFRCDGDLRGGGRVNFSR